MTNTTNQTTHDGNIDAQLVLRSELQSIAVTANASEQERNARKAYCHLADALSQAGLDSRKLDEAKGIIESQSRWLPADDRGPQLLQQMLTNYHMTLANPLANYNVGGSEADQLSHLASGFVKSFAHKCAAAYHMYMAAVLAKSNKKLFAYEQCISELRTWYAQGPREAAVVQAATLGALFGTDERMRLAAVELVSSSPLREWADSAKLSAEIPILRKWLLATARLTAGGSESWSKHYEPLLSMNMEDTTTVKAAIDRIQQEQSRINNIKTKRRSAGRCSMCGKSLGLVARVLLAKSHSGCTQFAEDR